MDESRPILDDSLTPEQRAAITYGDGPLLVIAGPGAGKTEVMVRRVAFLVRERGVAPEALLVTTFTRRAAAELRGRVRRFLGGAADRVFVSTIHGFCQWLLEAFPEAHPYGAAPQVLDDQAQFLLVFTAARDLGLDLPKGRRGEFLAEVVAAFSAYGEELVDPDRLPAALAAAGADAETRAVAEAYGRYLALLRDRRALDFAALQREAYRLLQGDARVRAAVQDRFRYLVVDEHQDTNPIQDLILRLVAAPQDNVCVVGDDDQSIYRFRGATVQNFLRFPEAYRDAGRIELGRNFRSTEPIVAAAARLIAHNPVRYAKALVAHRGTGPDVLLVQAEDVEEEGERLAAVIGELRARGAIARWRDVTVLYSSVRYYAEPLLRALAARGIPAVVTGDGGFFDRPDIAQLRGLVAMLGWASGWRPDRLAGPVLALRPETLAALGSVGGDLWDLDAEGLARAGVADRRDRDVLAALITLQRRVRAREHGSVLGLVHDLLAVSGYVADRLRAGDEAALLNVAAFTRLAEAFDRHTGSRSPARFAEYLWSLPERALDEARPPADDGVQVMTIHQAKGLEFPVVVVASVIEGRLPSRPRSRRFRVPDAVASAVMPEEIAAARREDGTDVHLADQRRLLYVGLTRARDLLVLGTSEKVRRQRCRPSRFLAEMGLEPAGASLPDGGAALGTAGAPGEPPLPELSFSAVHAYLTCPLRYRLLYAWRLSVPAWPVAQYGANLHRALAAVHARVLGGQPVDEATARALLAQHWLPFGPRAEATEERFRRSGAEDLSRYVREWAHTFPRVRGAELAFTYEAGDCLLTGRIDLVRAGEDGAVELVDFKTRTEAGASLQLGLYALAYEATRGQPVQRLVVHLLAEGREVAEAWTDATRARVREALATVVAGIRAERFAPAPGAHCAGCEVRALCPYQEGR